MSMLDYFSDWSVIATKVTISQAPVNGVWEDTETDGDTLTGILYNRSDAQRYFSQTWAADVQEIFVASDPGSLTRDDKLRIGATTYTVDSIVNEGQQNDVWTMGLRVHK